MSTLPSAPSTPGLSTAVRGPCDRASAPAPAHPLESREDWLALARELCRAAFACRTPSGTALALGCTSSNYDVRAQDMESFLRPLWAWIPLTAATGTEEEWPALRRGLRHALDPAHPEAWGEPGDMDQRSVEIPVLAFGLSLTPQALWQPLSPEEQSQLARWMYRINHVTLAPNNWLWFRVLVNLGLRRVGQPWDEARVETDLAALEALYLGEGWSIDGPGNNRGDYYNGMALHAYALVYTKLAADFDPARTARFRERARLFAQQFQHWFAADGAAVPFGRSLTYRFAQGAFWSAAVFADVEVLPWGVIKGLLARHVRWWWQQPIFSTTGCLTLGYSYPNLAMAEGYSSPGSPYWACKAFLHLAASADHPFWHTPAQPLPKPTSPSLQLHAGKVLYSGPGAGDVTALNLGDALRYSSWCRHRTAKYQKFAYSSAAGFCVPMSDCHYEQGGWDQMLAFSRDSIRFSGREANLRSKLLPDGVLWAEWSPDPGLTVQTWLRTWQCWQIRIHHLRSETEGELVDAGGCAPWEARAHLLPADTQGGLVVLAGHHLAAIRCLQGKRLARARVLEVQSNVLYPRVCLPHLVSRIGPGTTWLATAMLNSTSSEAARPLLSTPDAWTMASADDQLSLSFLPGDLPWHCRPL